MTSLSAILLMISVNYPAAMYLDKKDLTCLAKTAYHEARGEPPEGMVAVVQIVMNRQKTTLCKVVYKRGQFAWTKRPPKIKDDHMWKAAVIVSAMGMLHQLPDHANGATHFHSDDPPYWTKEMEVTAKIGGHIFYKED